MYSDHEIFLRELVSNAVDATQKLNTLASIGEFKGELGDLTIHVELGKDTITISDHGIGLTAEEIEKIVEKTAALKAHSQELMTSWKNTRMMQMLLSVISDLGSIQHLWSPRKLKSSPNRIEMVHKL